jgi:hypothetical protein
VAGDHRDGLGAGPGAADELEDGGFLEAGIGEAGIDNRGFSFPQQRLDDGGGPPARQGQLVAEGGGGKPLDDGPLCLKCISASTASLSAAGEPADVPAEPLGAEAQAFAD